MLTSGAFGYLADYLLWWLALLSLFVHTWCFFKFFPRNRHRKLGLLIGNALVFLCLLGFATMAGESYFRFACVETDAFGASLPARRWFALHTTLNSLGYRDREWSPAKPAGVRRIAFVGDSFTYGWGIERVEDRFTERVQAAFEGSRPGTAEVLNASKPGWGSGAQLFAIRDLIATYAVDEIVLGYVANDIEPLLPVTGSFDPTLPPDPTFFDPDRSCLVDFLYRTLWVPRLAAVRGYQDWLAGGFADADTWAAHQGQLLDIIAACRQHDVALRVILLPFIRTSGEVFDASAIHYRVRRFFEAEGVPVLDLLPAIEERAPADLVVNRRDAHPNALAHQLFANAIREAFYPSP